MSSWGLQNIAPLAGEDVSSWTGINFLVNRSNDSQHWKDYEWIVVVGGLLAFFMAWGIGANDVANSFATSVGAKTITLWQACVIAAIFEFTGAIALGGEVARTVAGSITSPNYFREMPEVFMFGMMGALFTAATWLLIATYWELAVSTTHSIIGAVLGFGLVYGGPDAIVWADEQDAFPYRKGFMMVCLAWIVAPCMSGILAALLFFLNRTLVLRSANSTNRAYMVLPLLVFLTVFINLFFVFFKGSSKELEWTADQSAWTAAAAAAGAFGLSIPFSFWLKRRHDQQEATQRETDEAKAKAEAAGEKAVDVEAAPAEEPKGIFGKIKKQLVYSLTVDVHEDVHKDAGVAAMHANMELFLPRTEQVYKTLQVFSASAVSFAHGANDVANAIGPFAGIWHVYNNFTVTSNAPIPRWILVLGAFGIVVGLGTYGYNIIKVLGVQMAAMTPSRGFSAELGTGLTISIASVYGLPISTTQCIVGAEVGVGLVEGLKTGANYKLFLKTFCGWIATIIITAATSAAVFAVGVYAPSVNNLDEIREYQRAMRDVMTAQINVLNQANLGNNRTYGPTRYDRVLATNLSGLSTNITNQYNYGKYGAPNKYALLSLYKNVTWLHLNTTLPTVGFSRTMATNTTDAITVPR